MPLIIFITLLFSEWRIEYEKYQVTGDFLDVIYWQLRFQIQLQINCTCKI